MCDEQLGFMNHMKVWERVFRSNAAQYGDGTCVETRWVFVNKGDNVRCRLAAQDIAGKDKLDDMYGVARPLPATRYLLSECVSHCARRLPTRMSRVLDVHRASLNGKGYLEHIH